MIKIIVFDLGSVIFKEDWIKLNDVFFRKFGISTLIRSQYGEKIQRIYDDALVGKKKMSDVFEEICKEKKIDHNIQELCDFYKEEYKKNKSINTEMIELIKSLKKKYKIVCFTDTNDLHFEAHKEQGILDLFDEKFASHIIGMRKKDPNVFEIVLKKLDVLPEEVLFIDDNPKNISSASSLGLKTILFKNAKELKEELKKY